MFIQNPGVPVIDRANSKPILGWEDRYLIDPSGTVVQLREKKATGLDLHGRFLYLDDGKAVAKVYIHELLAATFGRRETSQPEEIVAFLDSIADRMLKKLSWSIVGSSVVITLPVRLGSGKRIRHKMRLYLLDDAKAIFDRNGKYGRTFLVC